MPSPKKKDDSTYKGPPEPGPDATEKEIDDYIKWVESQPKPKFWNKSHGHATPEGRTEERKQSPPAAVRIGYSVKGKDGKSFRRRGGHSKSGS